MYLYRLEGGWLHDRSNLVLICYNLRKKFEQTRNQICYMKDLIWYLTVTILSYMLGTLTYLFYSNNIVVSHRALRDKAGCISYMRQRRQHI
jgi:hypothetical protein